MLGAGTRGRERSSEGREDIVDGALREGHILRAPGEDDECDILAEAGASGGEAARHTQCVGTVDCYRLIGHRWTGDLPCLDSIVLQGRRW